MRKIEGVLLNDIHTYKDLGLRLLGIQIDPADPKLETVSVPMSSSRLNLAKFLNPDIQYEWRNIVLSFDKRDDYHMWAFHGSNIKNLFHGQEVQLILDSDKGFYYTGTAIIETSKENNVFCDYLVTLEADPYKYERFSSLEPWVWDVFPFNGGIIRNYRDLEVNGTMTLLIPGRRKKVVPVFDCSSAMSLGYGGQTYYLPAGRSKLLDLQLGEGEHFLTFRGTGKVSVDYRGGEFIMYQIFCDNSLLYDPRDEDNPILTGKVSLTVNATGELTFSLPPMHKGIDLIRKLSSVVQVYDGGELLYEGRVLDSKSDMYHTVTYTCEGSLAYLLDSIQHPKAYHNLTPASYLNDKLIQHNSQVGAEKRFLLGTVEKQTMNYDAREDNQYTNTLDTIMDKLVDSNGGYLRVRKQGDDRYLDYLESYHRTSGQVIRFGENILDLTEHISAENVITVLIPLGKAAEGENREGGKRLTIESVNGGKDYLEDLEAVALYGRIVGTKNWDDVTVPANLKTKGQEYLAGARNLTATIELTAIDLHLVDVDIDRIRLGDMIRVVSPPHKLDKYMMVSKREYNLVNPQEDKIVLGDTIAALTERQAALQKNVEKQKHFSSSVEEVRGSVSILAGEVNSAKQGVSALDGKVQTLEGDSTEIQKTLQGINNSLTAQEEKMKGIKEDIQEGQGRLNELEREGQQIKETVQQILPRLDVLEQPDQELEERLQGILTRLDALEGGA